MFKPNDKAWSLIGYYLILGIPHLDLPGGGWAGEDLLQGVLVGGGRLGQHYLLLVQDQLPACILSPF